MMRLHIGCGSVKIAGFANVDIRYLPNVDVVDNAEFLRKFSGKEIDIIYACHVLEHFSRWRVSSVLKRWYDLLLPDGELFISVPDFEAVVNYYKKTKNLKSLIGLLYGGQDYDENFHHICWDFDSLKKDLTAVGFIDIHRYDYNSDETYFADFDDYSKCYLPHMDKENGMLMSLNVRAVK